MSALRIVLTGGECTGKTALARALAERHDTVWVPEAAREAAAAKARAEAYDVHLLERPMQ